MKKFDYVILKNAKPYQQYNLEKNMHGIVLSSNASILEVLFFNPRNLGDYIITNIASVDVNIANMTLPKDILKAFDEKLDDLRLKSKIKFEPLSIKAYDAVELIVEDSRYTKYGIHKGAKGCVMDDNAVQNYVEVDFSGINERGEYYGDCISVRIDDLKKI